MASGIFVEQYLCFMNSVYYEKYPGKNKPSWCSRSCDDFNRTKKAVQAKRVLDRLIDSSKDMKKKQKRKIITA